MQTKKQTVTKLVLALVFLSLFSHALFAQNLNGKRTLAIISTKNFSNEPKADYLGGIIQGLLSFDLSRTEDLVLVDRASLDKTLAEMELQASGIIDDKNASAKIGSLLGANYLLFIDYVLLSGEILVTVKSVDVQSGRQASFMQRGATENLVHKLAEDIAEAYTGTRPVYTDSTERSILTLRDETPGSISLFSIMRHAEIILDNEFIGYTTGNSEVPFLIEKLKPGKHTLRVHGDNGFGVVKLPEVVFKEWEVIVNVEPGKKHILKDETRDFNSVLYSLQLLIRQNFYYVKGTPCPSYEAKYVDRKGNKVQVKVETTPEETRVAPKFIVTMTVNENKKSWTISQKNGEEVEVKEVFESVELNFSIDNRYNKSYIELLVKRSDIWQNMYDEE